MINESDKTIVEVEGGIKVCVPLSLKYVTTFVLNEQHDWFEDEIKFLRKYIKPGMRVIDIGANYGVYTLMFAKAVGDNGYVWAFEPTKNTADFLRCSIRENNFQNISLQQVALSNRKGEARFFVAENSEMNSLSKDTIHGASYEMVIVNTLDDFAEKTHWNNLDFIKLDAEGEEANILKKGKEVLEKNSPLIMFELKHGGAINSGLITRFEFLGYSIFRLVPGLDMLIPFDAEAQLDPFLLNLFACKKETVIQLIQNGFLVTEWEDASVTELDVIEKYMMETSYWEDISLNSSITGKILSENYRDILATYILSRSNEITKDKRIGYLMWALKAVHRCVDSGESNIGRLSTYSRIAFDAGERQFGIFILSKIINSYNQNVSAELTEWFLPACGKFESVPPIGKLMEWFYAAVFEQYIHKHSYSACYTGDAILPIFQKLADTGFIDTEMRNRFRMIRACY